MRFLDKANELESALGEYGHLLSGEQVELVNSYIASLGRASVEYERVIHPENLAANCFLKITPMRVTPQVFYGSNVPSETVNELAVCKAKIVDGEWVADEDNVIIRAILPERALTEMIFNRESYSGAPVTWSELNGEVLPKYVPHTTASEEYTTRLDSIVADIKGQLGEIRDKLALVKSGDLNLTKSITSDIVDLTSCLSGYSMSDLAWELELVAEKIEKNSYHLRTEAIASISSSLSQIAEKCELQYADNDTQLTGSIAAFYDLGMNQKSREAVGQLLELVPEDDLTKLLSSTKSVVTNNSKFTPSKYHGVNQGTIKLSNPSGGGGHSLFGEDRIINNYFTFGFSFCYTNDDLGIDTHYTSSSQIMSVSMSEFQLMTLLQTSFADVWVKGTLARFMNDGVPNERESLDDIKRKKYSVSEIESKKAIADVLAKVYELTSGSLRSKAKKDEFVGLLEEFLLLSDGVFSEKDAVFQAALGDMFSEYRDETMKFVESAVTKVGSRLTVESKKTLLALLG